MSFPFCCCCSSNPLALAPPSPPPLPPSHWTLCNSHTHTWVNSSTAHTPHLTFWHSSVFASVDIIWVKIIQPLQHIEPFSGQVSINVCRVRLAVQNCTDSMYNIKNSWRTITTLHYCFVSFNSLYTVSNLGLWASLNQTHSHFQEAK